MNLNFEQHAHCVLAGTASTAAAVITFVTMEDILERIVVSIVIGVITWAITQMLSSIIKKKK